VAFRNSDLAGLAPEGTRRLIIDEMMMSEPFGFHDYDIINDEQQYERFVFWFSNGLYSRCSVLPGQHISDCDLGC